MKGLRGFLASEIPYRDSRFPGRFTSQQEPHSVWLYGCHRILESITFAPFVAVDHDRRS